MKTGGPTTGRWISILAGFAVAACGGDDGAEADSRPASGTHGESATPAPRPVDATKIALLVGVQSYAAGTDESGLVPLQGPHNDLALMRQLLLDRFAFDEGSIRILRDEGATLRDIVTSFHAWLIEPAVEDSEVLFYFSGHGSRVRDHSGVEPNELDSSFLAYDSRSGDRDGDYDLTDDAMQGLLQALARKTGRITVITDACFSGAGTRGQVLGVRGGATGGRGLAAAALAGFWPEDAPVLEDDDVRRRDIGDRYVHISACSNQQYAREWRPEGDEKIYGAFTYFLARALNEAAPGESHRAVAEHAQVLVSTHVPGQSVWFEGDLDREFLGGRFKPRDRGYVAMVQPDGRLRVEAGSLLGLTVGSRLRVFEPGGDPLALVEVDAVARGRCWAVLVSPGAPGAGLPGDRALRAAEAARPAGLPPLRVWTEDAGWREQLTASSWVAMTPDREAADYQLVLTADGKPSLVTVEGIELARDTEDFDSLCREEVRFRGLWNLADRHSRGELRIDLRFAAPTAAELQELAMVDAGVRSHRAGGGAAAGPEFTVIVGSEHAQEEAERELLTVVEMRNRAPRDVFVALLSLGENRELNVVWPRRGEQDEVVRASGSKRVPVWLVSDDKWSPTRPMRERYLAIATERSHDYHDLIRPSALRGGDDDATLPVVLARAFQLRATRGGADRGGAWGVSFVDLLVAAR